MADLDPALVELASRKIARSVYAKMVGPELVERYVDVNWHNHKDSATDALLSLGIPAAALNALAKGEDVVVPKVPTGDMIEAHQSECAGDADEAGPARIRSAYAAMLAASPYARKDEP